MQLIFNCRVEKLLPQNLVHGPQSYHGMGIPHLFNAQGALHMTILSTQSVQPTLTTKLIHTFIECAKIEQGLSNTLFYKRAWTMVNAATRTRVSNTMELIQPYAIEVGKNNPNLCLQRDSNQFLSDLSPNILISPLQR